MLISLLPTTNLTKVRPALILAEKGEDVVILGIFSKIPEQLHDSWIRINEYAPAFLQTGLKKTSIIKTEKIAVIHRSLIRKELGSLPPEIMNLVRTTLRKTLNLE